MKAFSPATPDHVRRTNTTAAAFLFGLPLAVVVLGAIHFGPLHHTTVFRYVEHPVECVEVILFCCAMAALGSKLWHSLAERRACNTEIIPPWDGRPVDVAEATGLLDSLNRLPWPLRNTFLNQKRTESRRLRPDPLPDQLDLIDLPLPDVGDDIRIDRGRVGRHLIAVEEKVEAEMRRQRGTRR